MSMPKLRFPELISSWTNLNHRNLENKGCKINHIVAESDEWREHYVAL